MLTPPSLLQPNRKYHEGRHHRRHSQSSLLIITWYDIFILPVYYGFLFSFDLGNKTLDRPHNSGKKTLTTLRLRLLPIISVSSSTDGIQVIPRFNIKNEHIVELLGYCSEGNNRILTYQYATMGSLHDVLHGRKGVQGAEPSPVLGWTQRVKIAYGTARGLDYLHEKVQPSIVHRDVRSSNVLLFDDCQSR